MITNKNLFKNTLWTLLFCICLTSCNYRNSATYYFPVDTDKFYEGRLPCKVLVVMKIEDVKLEELELIGTCSANKGAGGPTGKVNKAMKAIRECACKNGGDIVRIVSVQESSGTAAGGLVELYNPNATKVIYSDKIEAEVYRNKE